MKTTPRISAPASTPRLNVRRDAVANRDALLRAAQAVLASDPHASLDTIARAAGLSRRALYGHFPDRDSLLRAVIAVGAQRFNRIADLTGDPDPRIALAHLAVRLWQEASIVRASANIALDDAHVADTVRALSPLRRRVRQLTREGVELGVFRRDIAPPLLAVLVEETARATLRSPDLSADGAAPVVVRVVLSVVGLSWIEQVAVISEHAELAVALTATTP
ncbi:MULTISPECIES: TetR/AcrR family transcriptional regulator [Microbacterium]|uniref:TetR family transcriptional regulator n=1 Tax=Microbacterium aurum TaxID=36805 RepID=A0A1P8U766_9MICO|nr:MULTISPECIES: TetR/AcrR family transcriptional regulator [Microbacterium]APZ33957.1 TetR family transcriptional regulator [Microbacterium aurum]MBD3757503.1 TetR/AcrR family transcriptional regulator [Microbacterium sp.]MBM7827724.1 AcrR family transcriptional regulator [Microbacterium aurum]MCG7413315.1 TetR/AcrR family transcriptional regulator [Microbacterium aurum]